MQAKTITAKLRDAVPVRFMAEGEEKARYRNIDIPDALKELEIREFAFDTETEGKITFQLFFDAGVLPQEFPAIREKLTREEKRATKEIHTAELAAAAAKAIKAAGGTGVIVKVAAPVNADDEAPKSTPTRWDELLGEDGERMEAVYNVTGSERKRLVSAVATFLGVKATYEGMPSMAYTIGNYKVSTEGTLTGAKNEELINALAAEGWNAAA